MESLQFGALASTPELAVGFPLLLALAFYIDTKTHRIPHWLLMIMFVLALLTGPTTLQLFTALCTSIVCFISYALTHKAYGYGGADIRLLTIAVLFG